MRYGINKDKKPKKISIFLAKPNKTIIGKLSDSFNKRLTIKFTELNELSFSLPYQIERNHKLIKHPHIDEIKERFLIKVVYGNTVDWFIIRRKNKSMNDSNHLNVECYALGYELNYQKVRGYDVTSYNCFQAATDCLANTNWDIGYINPEFNLNYRKFDVSNSSKLDFIYKIAETFKGVVTFDTVNRLVNFWKEEEISTYKGFWISYGKYLQTIEQSSDIDEVVTRLHVRGSDDLTISGVNPTGELWIDDFSYYMYPFEANESGNVIKSSDHGMSDELCLALLRYNYKVSSNKTSFADLLANKKTKQELLSTENNKLTTLNGELKIILDDIEVAKSNGTSTTSLNKLSTAKQSEIKSQKAVIKKVEDDVATEDSAISSLKSSLKLENNLSDSEIEELRSYIHEDDWSDDNYIDENDLYEAAIEELKKKNSPPINITLGIVNFLEVVEEQRNWDKLNIGDIIKIKHDPLGIYVEAKIVEITFDFESSSISLNVSNVKKVKTLEDRLKEAFYTIKKVNTDYNTRKEDWMKTAINFNSRNDRIKDQPTNPILKSDSSVSHVTNDNGSINLTLSWDYPDHNITGKDADNIDGFYVYLYSSNISDPYIFGSAMAKESRVPLNFATRTYTFPNVPSNSYFTLGIRAYRYVDEDISREGILLSDIVSPSSISENPYLASPTVNVKGSLNGSMYTVAEIAPEAPVVNDVWMSSEDAKTRIWDGTQWKVSNYGSDASDLVDDAISKSGEELRAEIEKVLAEIDEAMKYVESEVDRIETEVVPRVEKVISETFIPKQPTPPAPNGSGLWWDTSVDPMRLKRYNASTNTWEDIAPTDVDVDAIIRQTEASIRNNIVTSINVSPESIKIDTNKLSVAGIVSFINSDGTTGTLIDGNRLISNSITAKQLNVNEIFANSAIVGRIQAGIVQTSELNATNIVSGTLDAMKISVKNLSASSIVSGELDALKVRVRNLNATDIISGTLKSIDIQGVNIIGSTIKSADSKTLLTVQAGNVKLVSNTDAYVTISPTGITGYNANGTVKYGMDSTLVTATALATSVTNVYLATRDGGEARVVDVAGVPSDGAVSSYTYRNLRCADINCGTINASAINIGGSSLATQSWVSMWYAGKTHNHDYTSPTFSTVTANAVDTGATHLYIRPSSSGKVRVTNSGTLDSYTEIEASKFTVKSSFRDLKTNILPVNEEPNFDAMQLLKSNRIYAYNYNKDIEQGIYDRRQVGMMIEDASPMLKFDGGLDIYQILAVLWNINQVQQEKIEKLEKDMQDVMEILEYS